MTGSQSRTAIAGSKQQAAASPLRCQRGPVDNRLFPPELATLEANSGTNSHQTVGVNCLVESKNDLDLIIPRCRILARTVSEREPTSTSINSSMAWISRSVKLGAASSRVRGTKSKSTPGKHDRCDKSQRRTQGM